MRAKRLEPGCFGFNIVRFYVQMHTTFVSDYLNFDVQILRRCLQKRAAPVKSLV